LWNATGIAKLVCGIVMGMQFIHAKGFIHRDLKPANILINGDGQALIGDFGTSCNPDCDYSRSGETGTVQYAAPEMFEEVEHTAKVDVFSFGSILYEILVGRPVFSMDRPTEAKFEAFKVLQDILSGRMPSIPSSVLPAMRDLIQRCWKLNADDRPSFDDIFRELEANHFAIVAGVETSKVSGYVAGVRNWEQMDKAKREA
jgi:serine/threonine protein kinase